MKQHETHQALDFTKAGAFIRGESTLAVVSVGTFDDVASQLESAIARNALEIVHVQHTDALLRKRGVAVDFRCRTYEVWNATLTSQLIRFDADVAHVLPLRITLHDQGGVTTIVVPSPRVVMTEFSHATEVGRIARRLESTLQQLLRELC